MTERPRWLFLLRPKWLCWHLFAVVATVAMLYLGDWQLHRAESGNQLSWAYTFEWPLFAICAVLFWVKSLRDELRQQADTAATPPGRPGTDSPAVAAGPADVAAQRDAYVARLKAEVHGHGRWHGLR